MFLLGYLKPYFSIPLAVAMTYALYRVLREKDDAYFTIPKPMFVLVCIVVPIWMLLSGQCGIFAQAMDWNGRNAILHDLVTKAWPVYYSDGSALTYYIGHFMVPGLFGKLLGLPVARIVLWLFTSFGVFLTYLYLVKITRAETIKKQCIVLLAFIFFGSMEDLRNVVTNFCEGIIKLWNPDYARPSFMIGFTSNARSMSWVFNQIVVGFLICAMFLDNDRDFRNIFVLGVPLILYSPFPLIAIFLLVLVGVIRYLVEQRANFLAALKSFFTQQNLIMLCLVAPVLLLYLAGNLMGDKPDELKFHFLSYGNSMYIYFAFIICEFLLYAACLFTKYKKNPYYYFVLAYLCALPLMKMGLYNDLCTRSSSIGMFVLMLFILQYFFETDRKIAPKWIKTVLCVLVISASVASYNHYYDIVKKTSEFWAAGNPKGTTTNSWQTLDGIKRLNLTDATYNFFTFNAADDFFYQYLACTPK